MGAAIQPDLNNPSPEDDQIPTPTPESTPEVTPLTPQPTPSPTSNDRYITTLEATLREQNRTIQQQADALARANQAPPAPAPIPRTVEEERQSFYNDPKTETRNIIRQELQETVAPLLDFVRNFKGDGSPFHRALNKYKSDPRFGQHLTPDIEAAVERLITESKAEPTDQNIQIAIVQALGLKAAGLLGESSVPANNNPPVNNNPPTPTPTVTPTPAHMRPSGAPTPRQGNDANKPSRPLTENEKRLARERKMSEVDYLKWLDVPADEVATSDIGRPAK